MPGWPILTATPLLVMMSVFWPLCWVCQDDILQGLLWLGLAYWKVVAVAKLYETQLATPSHTQCSSRTRRQIPETLAVIDVGFPKQFGIDNFDESDAL